MLFFHISDLHIGKQLYGYNLAEDQIHILSQIAKVAKEKQPDAMLITGDIYDKPVPSAEAVQIFDRFLTLLVSSCPKMALYIIAGNHDAARRIDYAGDILRRQNIHIVGTPPRLPEEYIRKEVLTDKDGDVAFYLLPFFRPSQVRGVFSEEENESYVNQAREQGISEFDLYFEKLLAREQIDGKIRNVLLTHQFFVPQKGDAPVQSDSEIHTVGTLDHIRTTHLAPFDYVAMGHLHRPQKCEKEKYRYCGTPMPYSLSEEKDVKSITIVELSKKEPKIETISLSMLRRVRKLSGTIEELTKIAKDETGIDDYVSLVVTDEEPGRYVKEQLSEYYSHILEIRFDNRFMKSLVEDMEGEGLSKDYFEMFSEFYRMRNASDMSEDEIRIFTQLLDETKEGEE